MFPPRDYPINSPPVGASLAGTRADDGFDPRVTSGMPDAGACAADGTRITLAAVLARLDARLPVTDAMIDEAWRTLRAAEPFLD